MPVEDPMDRPAKKVKHVSKDGKVVSIVTGPCVVFPTHEVILGSDFRC